MDVLITGASRGIGRATAVQLAGHGGRVVVNYLRNEEAAAETAELVRTAGGTPVVVQGDVRDPKDLRRLAQTLDRYDAVIHNAALGVLKPCDKIRANQWDLTMEVSVRPMWLLTMECLDRIVEGGSVIGLSSLGSVKFVPGYAAMGAAKGAVEALTRQLAVELSPKKIRVNTLRGGLVDTDALNYFHEKEKVIETAKKITPMGRLGTPTDIAKMVDLLLDERAGWLTGQIITVDGGLSLV